MIETARLRLRIATLPEMEAIIAAEPDAEMIKVAHTLDEAGVRVPVMVGGATTSPLHTALKIAPAYNGPVIWTKDASQAALLAARFMNPALSKQAIAELQEQQEELRTQVSASAEKLSIEKARENKLQLF